MAIPYVIYVSVDVATGLGMANEMFLEAMETTTCNSLAKMY